MADSIFGRIISVLNRPLPPILPTGKARQSPKGSPAPANPVPAPKVNKEGQAQAVDITAALRKRQEEIRKARAVAENEDLKRRLQAQQDDLNRLRREYEKTVAQEAQTHATTEAWTHTVVKGDTLWGIAKRYYGNGARWHEIHEANKGKITNPNLIYPGQVFVIPDKD